MAANLSLRPCSHCRIGRPNRTVKIRLLLATGVRSRGAYALEHHGDEAVHRRPRRRRRKGPHGGEHVACGFGRGGLSVKLSCLGRRFDHVSDDAMKVALRIVNMRLRVERLPQTAVMIVRTVKSVGDQNRLERSQRTVMSGADALEIREVSRYLPLVPGCKDLADILEMPIERCPADTRLFSNARHGDRMDTFRNRDRGGPVHDGVGDRRAMRFDSVVPELGHAAELATP